MEEDGRRVHVSDLQVLRRAVDMHPVVQWDDRMKPLANMEGVVKSIDRGDDTMNVRFPPPLGIVAWLPSSCLTFTEDGSGPVGRGSAGPMGRPRMPAGPSAGPAAGPGSFASSISGERARREQNMPPRSSLGGFGQRAGLGNGRG